MDLLNDIILTLAALLYVAGTVVIPQILKEKGKISKFAARKCVHLLAGLAIFITPYLSIPWFAVGIAALLTVVTFKSSKESSRKTFRKLYDAISEEAEEKKGYLAGPFHYCLAITSLMTIFSLIFQLTGLSLFYLPISGILIMIVSDTLASIVGKRWGRHEIRISWTGTTRTLEGSLTFFASALCSCFFAFEFFGVWYPGYSLVLTFEAGLILSISSALVGMVVEILSPSTWDDITVPIATTLLISLIAVGFGLVAFT